jgi:serine/threonine-protein kinase RsbW
VGWLVLLLWVVLIELLAGLTDLFYDEVSLVTFDDALDRFVLMPRDDDESVALAEHMFIVGGHKCDRLEAGNVSALAVVGDGARDSVPLDTRFDAFVHAPEDLFISGRPLREVHDPIIAPVRSESRPGPRLVAAWVGITSCRIGDGRQPVKPPRASQGVEKVPKPARGSESFEFPAELASLPRLRRLVRDFLAQQSIVGEERDQVVLVAHELAANAVEHGSEHGHPFSVEIRVDGDAVVIRITAPHPRSGRVQVTQPEEFAERGRGMIIVDALADWSEHSTDEGRVIVAVVPAPSS